MTNDNYTYLQTTPQGLASQRPMTISTKLLLQKAEELGISWETIPDTEVIKLSYQGQVGYFTRQVAGNTTLLAHECTKNKEIAKALFAQHGLSTPAGFTLTKQLYSQDLPLALKKLNPPYVVKPQDGTHGDFVAIGLKTKAEIIQNLQKIFKKHRKALMEEQFVGSEYRIMATREKLIAVTQRVPANVVGDGTSSIRKLVKLKNQDVRRGPTLINHTLINLKLDKASLETISSQGFTSFDQVPKSSQTVYLRQNSNLSTGGDSVDLTREAHPTVHQIATRAISAIPVLHFAGLDFMTEDIRKPQTTDSYRLIEINSSAGISMQHLPYQGEPQPILFEFLKTVLPNLE
jgi:cyanophycin synthetase